MEVMFKFCVKKYGGRPCLGTREVHGEEDEMQPNGKVCAYNIIMYTGMVVS